MISKVIVILISIIFLAVLFGTKVFAIISYILSSHVNITGSIESGPKYTLISLLKIIAIPTYIFLLFGFQRKLKIPYKGISFNLWLLFITYSLISYFWTPSQFLSHYVKQLGFFYAYTVGFIVIYSAWNSKSITENKIIIVLILVSILALLQTYVLGNTFGQAGNHMRLVSFTAKQQFAEFILAIFVIVLASKEINTKLKIVSIIAITILMILNGSRTGFTSLVLALVVYYIFKIRRPVVTSIIPITSTVLLASGVVLSLIIFVPNITEKIYDSRIGEAISAAQGDKIKSVGTVKDRLIIWESVENRVQKFTFTDFVVGRGLSSGGELFQKFSLFQDAGGNRYFHNEYLRVFYELGIIGAVIFFLFLASITVFAVKQYLWNSNPSLLVFLPGFFAFLAIENIFSAGGNAGGMGILLVFSYSYYNAIKSTGVDRIGGY
ncbi:MAG: O-antigen ligase family protein [Candidatus Thiodiazotropha weberae]|nr:O-antigen ligase family protein [Candidatus Thiodiazotropha weberae]